MQDHIAQRWRKPVRPLAVTDEPTKITVVNGRETQEVSTRLRPEDVDRIRLGYVCIHCWEPHESPFPENCSLCQYPMRDEQQKEFERCFGGTQRDPRAVRIEEGLDRVDDTHERRFHKTKTGIIVPRIL